MRIVGGKYKGRRLASPKSDATRPTSDRTRESLFNILENKLGFEGLRVLDLFAGTGALGIEALSRGAGFCVFVDSGTPARGTIRENIEALSLQGVTKVFKRDATRLGEPQFVPFELCFCDPPYGKGLGERAAAELIEKNWLVAGAWFVLEEEKRSAPDELAGFEHVDARTYGDTVISLYRKSSG